MESAYLRGLSKAGPVLAVLLAGALASLFVPRCGRQAVLRDSWVTFDLPNRPLPPSEIGYRPKTISVVTEPAGAIVWQLGTFQNVVCTATPCEIPYADAEVRLELPGYQSQTASLRDVANVPGGSLMLTFGPVERATGVASTKRSSVPSMRETGVHVSGRGLPEEVVQRIVRQNFGRFRLCYESGLRQDPSLRGIVMVSFQIGRDGLVLSAEDKSSPMKDAAVTSCVVRSFSKLSFPTLETGAVRATYGVVFTPPDS